MNTIPYGYCQCGCGQKTNIFKSTHSKIGKFKGQPALFVSGHWARVRPKPDYVKLFWQKVAITADDNKCWLWLASRTSTGYGQTSQMGYTKKAHRVAWAFPNYVIPAGMEICHSCDNPLCCNPKHLFLGTTQDNKDDMVRKGRQASGDKVARRGELHPRHKLTAEQVVHIRERYKRGEATQKAMAIEFGVSTSCISSIVHRRKWSEI